MFYRTRDAAEAAMAAWAETSEAPALALVEGNGSYHVIEADEDGVFIVHPDETVVDTQWTTRSGGLAALQVMNAYSVACAYHATYTDRQVIRVPHGTVDLKAALAEAIERADENACWRACDDAGPTFIEALSHGEGICPWSDGLPIPEDLSEEGPSPIVVIRTVDGRYADVAVLRGAAHVIVTDQDLELFDRSQADTILAEFGPQLKDAARRIRAVDLLERMRTRIDDVEEECALAQKTETDVAWILLNDFRDEIAAILGDAQQTSD